MARQFANNATTLLNANITAVDTVITVTPGTGGLFPAVDFGVDGHWMDATLEDVNGNIEIVRVEQHTAGSDTLTLAATGGRGLEGTTPFAFNAGARVELRLTAAALNSWLQADGDTIDGGDF